MRTTFGAAAFWISLVWSGLPAGAQDADSKSGGDNKASKKKPPAEVAGKADVLRHVKKRFAAFKGWDSENRRIELALEGDEEQSSWQVLADAEIKVRGWWGRIEQLRPGDRVWVWFFVDRDKKPVSVPMLADEISEQDIHDDPHHIDSVAGEVVTISVPGAKDKAPVRKVKVALIDDGVELKQGESYLLQTRDGAIREAVPEKNFSEIRGAQQDWLRDQWRTKGLPGTMVFLHPLSGEMDVMLDHEAMRWGRFLKYGDHVSILSGDSKTKARVKSVEPWRERTRIRLVTNSGLDQVSWSPGQRIGLVVPEPPAEVQASTFPTDIGRREGKAERVEWFLQTMYCTCGIAGDRCTGMFYTLSSCNVNACGGPKEWRGVLGEQIDAGKSDREIFEHYRESRGRDFWRPHLLR